MNSDQCLNCKNYLGITEEGSWCRAYPPDGDTPIPLDIKRGKHDHSLPFKGDNGIRYESLGLIDFVDAEL